MTRHRQRDDGDGGGGDGDGGGEDGDAGHVKGICPPHQIGRNTFFGSYLGHFRGEGVCSCSCSTRISTRIISQSLILTIRYATTLSFTWQARPVQCGSVAVWQCGSVAGSLSHPLCICQASIHPPSPVFRHPPSQIRM